MSCCKDKEVVESVQEYYGKELKDSNSLATNACCLGDMAVPQSHRQILAKIHPEILSKFYGCGSPIPFGLQGQAITLLDLGCGTGRDVYVASGLLGESGKAIGVDMTAEQLAVANQYQKYHSEIFGGKSNTEFHLSRMEKLDFLPDESVDVVISNCVLNLVPDKGAAIAEIFRVLKVGGELYFSDVFSDRRIPDCLAKDKVLWGECLSGALYLEDFRRLMGDIAGVFDYRLMPGSFHEITIGNPELQQQIAKASGVKFYSHTIRAFKLPKGTLEDRCEDFGQEATYLGGIPESPDLFVLDKDHQFKLNDAVKVCGNTAKMLTETRFSPYFSVTKPGIHKGLFQDCKNNICC